MTDNKMTPEQFVREWLPEYQEKRNAVFDSLDEVVRFYTNAHQLDDCVVCAYFHEALAAYADHIRKEAWDQACEKQRIACADAIRYPEDYGKGWRQAQYAAETAPAPEFKITEKEGTEKTYLVCDDCGKQDETVKRRERGSGKQCYKCYKDELFFEEEYK